jgi:hypothetical protein
LFNFGAIAFIKLASHSQISIFRERNVKRHTVRGPELMQMVALPIEQVLNDPVQVSESEASWDFHYTGTGNVKL